MMRGGEPRALLPHLLLGEGRGQTVPLHHEVPLPLDHLEEVAGAAHEVHVVVEVCVGRGFAKESDCKKRTGDAEDQLRINRLHSSEECKLKSGIKKNATYFPQFCE